MKIHLGMILDFEIAGDIHKSHFLFYRQEDKDLSSDLIGEAGQCIIHVGFWQLLFKLQDFQITFYCNDELISLEGFGKIIIGPVFHRSNGVVDG